MRNIYSFIYQLLTSNKIKKIQSQVENKLKTQTRIIGGNYFQRYCKISNKFTTKKYLNTWIVWIINQRVAT